MWPWRGPSVGDIWVLSLCAGLPWWQFAWQAARVLFGLGVS